jgi:hypothetical protein
VRHRCGLPSCRRNRGVWLTKRGRGLSGRRPRHSVPHRATYYQAVERHWAHLLDLFNRALALH